jgi:hypothetical protein
MLRHSCSEDSLCKRYLFLTTSYLNNILDYLIERKVYSRILARSYYVHRSRIHAMSVGKPVGKKKKTTTGAKALASYPLFLAYRN